MRRVILHCGLPRTGTTSFQAGLSRHRQPLCAQGVIYPSIWQTGPGLQHHGVVDRLEARTGIEEIGSYIDQSEYPEVLISTEGLSNWVTPPRRSNLVDLIRRLVQHRDVTCMWTLRRMDDFFNSMYLQRLTANDCEAPERYVESRLTWIQDFVSVFEELREAGASVEFSRYDRSGSHYDELLAVPSLSAELRAQVRSDIKDADRVGGSLSRKGVVALRSLDRINQELGEKFQRRELSRVLWSGELKFENDETCEVLGPESRRSVHTKMIDAARANQHEEYERYFGTTVENASPPNSGGDLEDLDPGDLEKIRSAVTSVRERKRRQREAAARALSAGGG